MKRLLLATALVLPVAAAAPGTPQPHLSDSPEVGLSVKAGQVPAPGSVPPSFQKDLGGVFAQMKDTLTRADTLAARLKELSAKQSVDVSKEVMDAEMVLGTLASRVSPTGDLAMQLKQLRTSAQQHWERIKTLPKNVLMDNDRSLLLQDWQSLVKSCDDAAAKLGTMSDQLGVALDHLRQREAAISEFLLVSEYQVAVKGVVVWVASLQQTLGSLHNLIDPNVPTS